MLTPQEYLVAMDELVWRQVCASRNYEELMKGIALLANDAYRMAQDYSDEEYGQAFYLCVAFVLDATLGNYDRDIIEA